jgi:alkyldihydroxyacetonephosphate synthase
MSDVIEALRDALGERVRTDGPTLDAHRRDTWVLGELRDFEGHPPRRPIAVVQARSTDDVAAALRVCGARRVPVVPYGGGSGVCGGIQTSADTVVVSTRGITGLREIDEHDLTARFGAGTMGDEAERLVREHGLTIGHWPQSIALSTVGGWVATRASGQYSTAYGNIEDVLLALEAVLPGGDVLRTPPTPRAAAGPDLRQILLGSEGTLGVVTEVTFSLRAIPPAHRRQAFHFDGFAAAVEPIREILRAGWRPPVVRLYDPRESRRHFRESCPKGRAMLILLHEGPEPAVPVEAAAVADLCRAAGGEPGDPEAVDHWFDTRNTVPGFRSFIEGGTMVDTIEVASTWRHVAPIYHAVTEAVSAVPGVLASTAHTSHAYRSGANLYFTFAVKPAEPADMADAYAECWRRTMQATLRHGGGIAHHHGIGRVRRAWMRDEWGDAGVGLLRALKRALDPDGLLNPGVLLPGAEND